MSNIQAKKFKKLQKELDYWQSELEYVQEILKEEHLKFEEYHRQYCKDNDISALYEKNFQKILDICSKHAIILEMSEELNKIIEKQIENTKQQINKEKSTYSWKMHLCGQNKLCKNVLVQQFLKQLFNYEGKK